MQPITNSLITSTRKAAKLLQRDYFELEMLQTSSRGTNEFCNKSYLRTKTLLEEELKKHSATMFFSDQSFKKSDSDIIFLINPIDSITNLGKGLPFFCIAITVLKKINNILTATSFIMNFPALGEVYYAENGGGAWVEKDLSNSFKAARIRVSNCSNLENSIVSTNETATRLSKNMRYFGSACYDFALFASGKIDAFSVSSLNYTLKQGFDLMAQESGGFIITNNAEFIASNANLAEKIKQHLRKTDN